MFKRLGFAIRLTPIPDSPLPDMLRSSLLYLSERDVPRKLLSQSSLGRRMARRFIAGEEVDDAMRAVRRLNADGFEATLDYLGESVNERAAAEQAAQVYLGLLNRLDAERLRSHISVKLTQLGLAVSEELACGLLKAIAERAAQQRNFVRIDMEGSAYTEGTLRVFREVNAPVDVLGVVVQSYLYRSERDVSDVIQRGARVRLVKGAYKEPPEVAFPHKADVDRNFVKVMQMLLASGGYHAIATHDPRMIAATQELARSKRLAPDRYEFQMLYGIRRQLQRELLKQGYRMRVYVPYGKQWYAYFMRRLAERPANLLFLMRNIVRE
ncbi:MAG TPA: proline dehydrogenase family protein [Terriglobia bacterium]|nr:proline dehydrogenase family protein [Terriglobia bacterium]